MSSLSEEQRQKIEENKRKALALRAARQKQPTCRPISAVSGASLALPPAACITGSKPVQQASLVNQGTAQSQKVCGPQSTYPINSSAQNQFRNDPVGRNVVPSHLPPASSKGQNASSFYQSQARTQGSRQSASVIPQGRTKTGQDRTACVQSDKTHQLPVNLASAKRQMPGCVSGTCVLISRTRFEVHVGYSGALIELFKSMDTKLYSPEKKCWSFHLREYQKLMNAVGSLQAKPVQLDPLPKAALRTFAEQLKGHDCPTELPPDADLSQVDPVLVETLLPFQREGVNIAVQRHGRILIADDMGLGKTLQALCVACYYRAQWPLLIVVPSSVRFAWKTQILQWIPSLDPQEVKVILSGKDRVTSGQVIIVSYDLLVRREVMHGKDFDVIIMDESHFLKNAKTVRTKAAVPLLKRAARVILLSGTPALSRPSELFTQISAVNPRIFPNFHEFAIRYCAAKQMQWGWDYGGSSNMEELQLILQEQIMIRRLKKDVLCQLPTKRREMIVLDQSAVKSTREMKASHKMVGTMKGQDRRGALLEYFHDTSAAKASAVRDYILDLLESDNKFLFFAHHQDMLDCVEEAVKKKKYRYIRIDGQTSSEQRNQFCSQFQLNDEVKVAILSIMAANAGLNLTSASLVVFGELFWNPGILVQAEDRVHRLGQEDCVSIRYLVATGTADDYIWPLVKEKLNVLGKAGLSKDDFSTADTSHRQESKQQNILSYFESSFFEESEPDTVMLSQAEKEASATAAARLSAGVGSPQKSPNKTHLTSPRKRGKGTQIRTPEKLKQGTLFKYLSPTKRSSDEKSHGMPGEELVEPQRISEPKDEDSNITNVDEWDSDFPEDFIQQQDWLEEPAPKKSRLLL